MLFTPQPAVLQTRAVQAEVRPVQYAQVEQDSALDQRRRLRVAREVINEALRAEQARANGR